MQFVAQRQQWLKPLQTIINVVERRQTLPALSHVLINARADAPITFTATDLDVELVAETDSISTIDGDITLPAYRFRDILRSLPEESQVRLIIDGNKATIRAGKSRFALITLPADDYPSLLTQLEKRKRALRSEYSGDSDDTEVSENNLKPCEVRLPQSVLAHAIRRVHYAMSEQDVRHYLNGVLFEVYPNMLRMVATDGHRMAIHDVFMPIDVEEMVPIIVPRKGILELLRLLNDSDTEVVLQVQPGHLRVQIDKVQFIAKLLEGKYPDYQRAVPASEDRAVLADRAQLRQLLARTALVLSGKSQGVAIKLSENLLCALAKNQEQEEAEEELEVAFEGEPAEIGFNATYLLDALGALTDTTANLFFSLETNSCMLQEEVKGQTLARHMIMPLRL